MRGGPQPGSGRPRGPVRLKRRLIDDLCALLRAGNYIETACNVLGISRKLYYEWAKDGANELDRRERGCDPDKSRDLQVRLHVDTLRAIATAEALSLQVLTKAAESDWRAAESRLARRWPERWSAQQKITMTPQAAAQQLRELLLVLGHDHTAEQIEDALTRLPE